MAARANNDKENANDIIAQPFGVGLHEGNGVFFDDEVPAKVGIVYDLEAASAEPDGFGAVVLGSDFFHGETCHLGNFLRWFEILHFTGKSIGSISGVHDVDVEAQR